MGPGSEVVCLLSHLAFGPRVVETATTARREIALPRAAGKARMRFDAATHRPPGPWRRGRDGSEAGGWGFRPTELMYVASVMQSINRWTQRDLRPVFVGPASAAGFASGNQAVEVMPVPDTIRSHAR
jgi:hypothetical protein